MKRNYIMQSRNLKVQISTHNGTNLAQCLNQMPLVIYHKDTKQVDKLRVGNLFTEGISKCRLTYGQAHSIFMEANRIMLSSVA